MRKLLILCISGLLASLSFAHDDHKCEHTALGDQMEILKDNFQGLRKSGDQAQSLTHIEAMIEATKASLELEPKMAEELTGEEREEFVAGYKKGIEEMLALLEELKTAVEGGDSGSVRGIIGKLGQHSKQSHGDYKYDC